MIDEPTSLTLARPRELLATVAAVARRRGRRSGLSDTEIDDVTQTVLTKYADLRSRGERPDNVAGYLETATANTIKDLRQRAERRKAVHADPHGGVDDPVAAVVQLRRSQQYASLEPLGAALEKAVLALLDPGDADLIRARFLDELPAVEVAAELGISPAAVDQRVRRARRRLQVALETQPELLADLRAGHPRVYAVDDDVPLRPVSRDSL